MKKMKNIIYQSIRSVILVAAVSISLNSSAQGPPPPPPGGSNNGGNQNGGNAPIEGGLFVLLGLGAAYGGKKIYQLYREGEEALEE